MAEGDEGTAPPRRAPSGGGGDGNVFTRKLGPAPVWLWMAGGLGVALAVSSFRGNKRTAAAAATAAPGAGAVQATQTPPFIIQNYPGVGVPGPAGAQGPPGPAGTPGAQGPPGPVPVDRPPAPPPVVPPAVTPPPQPAPPPVSAPPPPPPREPLEYRVHPGDNLSSIAARYGTTAERIWSYNLDPANGRSAQAIATLLQRGPNLLYSNELLLIPQ